MNGIFLAMLCISHSPTADFSVESQEKVDVIEVNHLYDHEGRHVIDQLIFYEWSNSRQRYDVRAWRKLRSPSQYPTKDWQCGMYRVTWYEGAVLREVWAESKRETWTTYDPEVLERDVLPVSKRRELRSPEFRRYVLRGNEQRLTAFEH